METKMVKEKPRVLSYVVFGTTLTVVVINLVSLYFPTLIVSLVTNLETKIDPFELGVWTIPSLVTNLFLLGFGILYYKNVLATAIRKPIKFILEFEVSRKVAALSILILFGGYVAYAAQDLPFYEGFKWADFTRVEQLMREFPDNPSGGHLGYNYVTNFLLKASEVVFQNIKIAPLLASISLLFLTYLFTVEITKKRFAGLVAVIVLLQSFTFQRYDSLATYPNFWILFYLLSVYLIYKKPYSSSISYLLSVFSKPLTAPFLPLTLFAIYNTKLPTKQKIYTMIPYVIIIAMVLVLILSGIKLASGGFREFNSTEFITAFTTLAYELRFDGLILIFLLPLTVALFLTSRKGIVVADSVLVLIMGTILVHPLMVSITDFGISPYRYMPFIVFFAIGVGTLFAKKIS